MKQATHKSLTVYKASAGSGKTFTLATEYMKLVIANPQAYRSILAVTFTNKATEEMKLRIISQLYGMSRQLPESESYLRKIQESLDYSREQVAQRAGAALQNLLHHYNYFKVGTIDSFFQQVMRNLAKELELTANLRVDLNDKQVEEQAVDALIESLNVGDKLLVWILDYIRSKITEDKSWNVIGEIKDFGLNIFKDFYKTNEKALNEKVNEEDFFRNFTQQMRDIKKDVDDQIQQIAATFFDTLDENGLSLDDFYQKKKGIWGYFNKLRNGTCYKEELGNSYVQAAIDSPEGWFSKAKASPKNPAFTVVCDTLYPLLQFSEEKLPTLLRLYKSADVTASHLSQLRLLSSIDQKVREMNQEANRFLLSDTQPLLQSLINSGGNDSPFIFEKIGTQLEHIMIDEFQDTSTIQWRNFKVLLEETMSHENSNNLIVGDVKQSIYRWRAGDWKLLNDIANEFGNSKGRLQIDSLAMNYRSDRNIIEFNNRFFVAAVEQEYQAQKEANPEGAEMLKQAYHDVEQQVPEGKPHQGYVRIELLANEDYRENMMQRAVETVDELFKKGIKEKQIAILIRGNKTIRDVADYFLANRPMYKLVSDEAFRLEASAAVNILVLALKLLLAEDDITQETLEKYYQKFLATNGDTAEGLPAAYTEHKKELLELPLFDLVEELAGIFHIHKMQDQSAYVCAFYDQLNKFLQDGTGNIDDFVKEWDERLHSQTIQSDDIDGIRLLTIHKSKGLEYDNIIMPFCDWRMEKPDIIWCKPEEEPFNQLPLVPVDYSDKKLLGTIYEKEYQQEHLQNMVDNMNLLYVAFTRAKQNLFVYGKRDTSTTRSYLIQQSIEETANHLEGAKLAGLDDEKTDPITFEYGALHIEQQQEKKAESQNVFLKSADHLQVDTASYPIKAVFRQSNKSRDFIEGEDEMSTKSEYMRLGTILHQLFSTIETVDDVDRALKQLELDGVLYDDNISEEKLRDLLRQRLESPEVRQWFSGDWTSYNECSILSVNPETNAVETHRPDRVITDGNQFVVIDFKFAAPHKEHQSQVKDYVELLKKMGHDNVKGYLWYVYPNKITEV